VTEKILLISGTCQALAVGAVVCLFVAVFVSLESGERHQRQIRGAAFGEMGLGEQPPLFAVAQAIVRNAVDLSTLLR
jgi:hypothetical protein